MRRYKRGSRRRGQELEKVEKVENGHSATEHDRTVAVLNCRVHQRLGLLMLVLLRGDWITRALTSSMNEPTDE